MLYLYEVDKNHDNNDAEVIKAYGVSNVEKEGYIAVFDFPTPEEASQEIDSWLLSQGVTSRYTVSAIEEQISDAETATEDNL